MKKPKISLQTRIVFGVSILLLMALVSIIGTNIFYQQKEMKQQFENSTSILADAVYNAILCPMTVGDSETIVRQMTAFGKNSANVKVYIFGFDKLITYASEPGKANSLFHKSIKSTILTQECNKMLATGIKPRSGFNELRQGTHFLGFLLPLKNEQGCEHCHGSSRSTLGGILVEQNSESMFTAIHSMRNKNILVGLFGGLAVVLFVIVMVSRFVDRPIRQVISDLNETAGKTLEASKTVASISRQIAEGATHQAAVTEETSASLEEVSAMTKQNSENATEADNLMRYVKGITSGVEGSMSRLMEFMQEISNASYKTQKIVKTIDEIAFQTNLLALNAAVEAARAGEAGAGFAVVADEVRNLAGRASEAAKTTADLIKGNVAMTQTGAELAKNMSTEFTEVVSSVSKAGNLAREISAASREQALGVAQVSQAVSEIDRVVQQTASHSDAAASASAQMEEQARHMTGFIKRLVLLIEGA